MVLTGNRVLSRRIQDPWKRFSEVVLDARAITKERIMISGQGVTCSDAIVCQELYEILLTGRLAVVTMSGVDLTFHKLVRSMTV